MGVSDHKCLACNASLKFDPKSQKWICDYCGSEFTLKDFRDEKGKKKNVRISKNKGYMEYCCPDCGAKIVMNENTAATECVYCGNSAIILDHLEGEFKPNRVIPFKLTKEDAIAAYGKHTKRKKFMPKAFSDRKNIEKVTGIYVPFYLFDMKVNGYLNAEGVHVTKWINGNYRVVKSEYYDVVRDGIMFFDKIPTDASKKMGDDIMDSIEPYNYEDLTRFDISYMSGFVAEKYDLDAKGNFKTATTTFDNTGANNTWTNTTSNTEEINLGWEVSESITSTSEETSTPDNGYSKEFNDAYAWAFKNGITTMSPIEKAEMNAPLTRIAMAKMLSQYAINVLGRTPDTTKVVPAFPDVSAELDAAYNSWVTLAYQLGIMWINIDKFRPDDLVTRAEFGTALSRMLYGLADGEWAYYETHLAKLMEEKIITVDTPDLQELRGYVMIMLMRSANK